MNRKTWLGLKDQEKLSEHTDIWDVKLELISSRKEKTFLAKGSLGAQSWERKAHGVCEELKAASVAKQQQGREWHWDSLGNWQQPKLLARNTGTTFMERNVVLVSLKMYRPSVPETPFQELQPYETIRNSHKSFGTRMFIRILTILGKYQKPLKYPQIREIIYPYL